MDNNDYRNPLQESIDFYDNNTLDVLCQIAEEEHSSTNVIDEFSGKLAVLYYIGLSNLKRPHRMKFLVLDWFRYLIIEQGIDLKNITSGAFLLSLKKNDDDNIYEFDALYNEIIGWAKREFDINLIFHVEHNPMAKHNEFNFVAGLSGDINNYKNKIQLWHSGKSQ